MRTTGHSTANHAVNGSRVPSLRSRRFTSFLTQHKFHKTALLNSTLLYRQFIACHAHPTSSAGAFNLLKFALIPKKKKNFCMYQAKVQSALQSLKLLKKLMLFKEEDICIGHSFVVWGNYESAVTCTFSLVSLRLQLLMY